jgi:UDP-glucose 4-epimerase
MSKIVITGAYGFIGKHLASWLAQKKHQVIGIGHGRWSSLEAAAWGVSQWIDGDIKLNNLRLLQQYCGTPDVVYHLAGGSSVGLAFANPDDDFLRTVQTTADLLKWLQLHAPQTRLVAISSAAVYGANHEGNISEDATLKPYSPYGHHKLIMEQMCQTYASSYGLKVGIARLFSVFGPELKKQLLWDTCSRLSSNIRPIKFSGSGNELRDWTDVRDVVRALHLIESQSDSRAPIFNVGTGIGSSVREVVYSIAKLWPVASSSETIQFSGHSRLGDPFSLIADPRRLTQLGFSAERSLSQGLLDYVRWFHNQRQERYG